MFHVSTLDPKNPPLTEEGKILGQHWDRIDSVELDRYLIQDVEELVILDVRTQEEYDAGHIEGATLIPVLELSDRLDELDKGSELLVYCRTGNRSSSAVEILENAGFTKLGPVLDIETRAQ